MSNAQREIADLLRERLDVVTTERDALLRDVEDLKHDIAEALAAATDAGRLRGHVDALREAIAEHRNCISGHGYKSFPEGRAYIRRLDSLLALTEPKR